MAKTAWPVLEGAFSSFLGFVFLAASDFAFVRKYFFLIFLMIVVFGAVNALVFLPALLGLLGQMRNALMLLVANTTWMCSEPCMLESSRDAAARSSGLLQSSLYLEVSSCGSAWRKPCHSCAPPAHV